MAEEAFPPFSARFGSAQAQIDNDCPRTARMGLLHILKDVVKRQYVQGWPAVNDELKRIARVSPSLNVGAEELLESLPWPKVYDFCERLYNHLATDRGYFDEDAEVYRVTQPRSEVQQFIANELRLLFAEERLAFEFSNGIVRRRGRQHTAKQVALAEVVLADPRFSASRIQFNKALGFFRHVPNPDYENAIKEAVCAVEAVARVLFPSRGTTLGKVIESISGSELGEIPHPIAKTFHGLYGFRNHGQGVTHGGSAAGGATKEIAEYALALAASQIIFLVDLSAASEPEVPF